MQRCGRILVRENSTCVLIILRPLMLSKQKHMLNFRDRHLYQPKGNTEEAGQELSRALEILVYKKSR